MKIDPIYKTIREKQTEEECSNTRVDNEQKNEEENIVQGQIWKDCKKARQTYVSAIVHKHLPSQHVRCCARCQTLYFLFQDKRNTFLFDFLSDWLTA